LTHSINGRTILNIDNEKQLNADEGRFILFIAALFSVLPTSVLR